MYQEIKMNKFLKQNKLAGNGFSYVWKYFHANVLGCLIKYTSSVATTGPMTSDARQKCANFAWYSYRTTDSSQYSWLTDFPLF